MARRPPQHAPVPPAPAKRRTALEMQRGIERLKERMRALEAFDPKAMVVEEPPEIAGMQVDLKGTLKKIFGEGTADYLRFESASDLQWTTPFAIGDYPSLVHYQEGIAAKIAHSLAILGQAVRFLEEEIADSSDDSGQAPTLATPERDLSKVFIVHGHDGEARQTTARFIEQLGLEAIILHERPNKGRTIITKFREEAAGVGFAVVLMTPDDVGGPASAPADRLNPRARQNVVFELGFFIGELGADRVAALIKGSIERPSDFDGVVYISLDSGNWKAELGRELQAAGYNIDWNKVMRP